MVAYRRNFVAGGTYFFTVTLKNRKTTYLTDYIDELRNAFRLCRNKQFFTIDAIVILPDHLHTIWGLPEGDIDYPSRWRFIKSSFTRNIRKSGVPLNANKHGGFDVWQRRYWEHTIKSQEDYNRHIDYIHYNPVKHGYVENPTNWPWSSFHSFVKKGVLEPEWGSVITPEADFDFGE
ncbi:REP-associated tyrosine transposase [Alkalimarinus coralli]|uniref:REP-associated tyrosine transposase n=1 Tax=Alkalimarinus coralli TaxID=2935863 RepID=UPI00202AF3E2|nr:transposase [Alkalimarinus coralli]